MLGRVHPGNCSGQFWVLFLMIFKFGDNFYLWTLLCWRSRDIDVAVTDVFTAKNLEKLDSTDLYIATEFAERYDLVFEPIRPCSCRLRMRTSCWTGFYDDVKLSFFFSRNRSTGIVSREIYMQMLGLWVFSVGICIISRSLWQQKLFGLSSGSCSCQWTICIPAMFGTGKWLCQLAQNLSLNCLWFNFLKLCQS